MLRAECQSAQMSKITNYALTRSGKGCFIAVPIYNSEHQRVNRERYIGEVKRPEAGNAGDNGSVSSIRARGGRELQ